MSSGSSGRYQSKLFNFVDQRSRRLTNQLKLVFHNIQVAAIANIETLFSSLFHLWDRDASRNLLPFQRNKRLLPLQTEASFKQHIPVIQGVATVINDLFRLAINQKPLIDLPQEVESKFIPSVQSKGLPQIERSPAPDLIDDDWLAWNDLFDQIKVKVNSQIKESQHSHEIKAQPDWIEINARFLGYEKHPLEQVLKWLDQILLTLEQVFKNCCFFFKGLLGG